MDRRRRATIENVVGIALTAIGVVGTSVLYEHKQTLFVAAYLVAQIGMVIAVRGAYELMSPETLIPPQGSDMPTFGYKSFVAWRYLLVPQPRVLRITKKLIASLLAARLLCWVAALAGLGGNAIDLRDWVWVVETLVTMMLVAVVFWGVLRHSKPATYVFVCSVLLVLACIVATWVLTKKPDTFLEAPDESRVLALQIISVAQNIFGALAGIAMFFGILRAFFSFFTTVPIGGVWIGTAALVCVLSVMSGFESDLREKILGSNAHIQITREDGDFVEWRDAKARVDKIPGVVASTPYAVSEVVIAAHNNGMNVIIKGIDPKSVGRVTDLVSDLEDKEAMQRLDPLIDDSERLQVPQVPVPTGGVDPPPADMPSGGDPIDFSVPAGPGSGSDQSTDDDVEPPSPYGGDATALVGANEGPPLVKAGPVVDPPPDDLVTSDEPPIDYSTLDPRELPIDVVDLPEPTLSKRTQSLPGVLVGRELVKQTHLYTGEEVRVVSPLSDSANPDATGTPIPFNRDYRVAGIFYTGMYEYDLKYVYVSLDSLQDFLDRGDAVDGIEVRIGDADDTPRFVKILQEQLGPSYRVQDWHELNRSLFSALKLEKIAMFLVLGIVILVASFSIVGNLIMVVVEKAREIALLKTLGASDVGVMQLFAIQGLLIGVIGTLLGVATGLLGCWAGMRFGLPLNPDVYYIDRLPIHIEVQSVLASAAAGVFISIAATMYPALLAARVRPAAGMRH